MDTMKRIAAGLVLLAAVPLAASAGEALTLERAAALAVERSHGLKALEDVKGRAEAGRDAVAARRNPRIGWQSSVSTSDDPVAVFGTTMRQGRFTAADMSTDALNHPSHRGTFRNTLSAALPLYTGGGQSAEERAAVRAVRVSDAQYDGRRQAVLAASAEAYLQAAHYAALEAAAADAERRSDEELRAAQRLLGQGMVAGADYHGARALARQMTARKIQAGALAQTARERLRILTGVADARPAARLGRLPGAGGTLEELTARAAAQRADLAAAREETLLLHERSRAARAARLPRVEAFADLSADTDDLALVPVRSSAGVRMEMPLGDGGIAARIREADTARRQAEEETRDRETQAVREVTEAWQALQAARQLSAVSEDALSQAREAVRLLLPQYRQGRRSVLDMLRAEHDALAAEAALGEARYGAYSARVRLLAATGELDERHLAEIAALMEAL